jgi:hypothetical protein
MKCSKCGFISFDYLSTCKKCGTNLSQARSGLGFSDSMPSPPAFLKALVEDVSSTAGEGTRREAKASAISRPSSEAAPTPGDEISLNGLLADESLSVALDAHEDTDQWEIDHSWLDELDEPASAESLEGTDDLVLELIDDEGTGKGSAPGAYQDVSLETGDDQRLPAWELHLDEGLEDTFLEDLPIETGPTAALEREPEGSQAESGQEAAETEFSLAEFDDDVDDLVLGLDDDEADLLTLVDDDLPTEKNKSQTRSESG